MSTTVASSFATNTPPSRMAELSDQFANQTLRENTEQAPASPSNDLQQTPIDFQEVKEIENQQRSQILDVVDKLRHLGINDVLSIPQIVVFGDTSSGKSSLLEGLTNIPFPVKSQLCTRFATQITLRRSPSKRCTFSILPGPSRRNDKNAQDRLTSFHHTCELDEFSKERFVSEIEAASAQMGINVPNSHGANVQGQEQTPEKRFADDILCVVVSGPDQLNLTIVDVPGLIHTPLQDMTEEDSGNIRKMIIRYLQQPRTMIMAVMQTTSDFSNQEIFKMARSYDTPGLRTIFVITKPDRVERGNEEHMIRVASNQVHWVFHGWFVVRNRTPEEVENNVGLEERNDNERRFFESEPWNSLSSREKNCGIKALRQKLGDLLGDHTLREIPKVRQELETHLANACSELERLGPERDTPSQQRRYLMDIASTFQRRVSDALIGNFAGLGMVDSSLRIQRHINAAEEWFVGELGSNGRKYEFEDVEVTLAMTVVEPARGFESTSKNLFPPRSSQAQNQTVFSNPTQGAGQSAFGRTSQGSGQSLFSHTIPTPLSLSANSNRSNNEFEERSALLPMHFNNIYEWITEAYRDNRGFELPGLINPLKVDALFREQSSKWDEIAAFCLDKIQASLKDFIRVLCTEILGDQLVCHRLKKNMYDNIHGSLDLARSRTAELLENERGTPSTINEGFTHKLNRAKYTRFLILLRKHGFQVGEELKIPWETANRLFGTEVLDSRSQAVNDLHDILKAFYDISVLRFRDNMRNIVIKPLLNDEDGPLKFFTEKTVGDLSDKELDEMCSESEEVRRRRQDRHLFVAKIEEALRTIQTV